MARKNRKDLRQKRAEQKRAERLSRVPDMLADEQALRDSVDALYQRSKKIGQHLKHDRDREELANGIDLMLANYETIEAGIERNRLWILTELARRESADA
jgi:hypothetical protein